MMKRFISLAIIFFILILSFQPTILAAGSSTNGDSVYDTILKGEEKEKSSPEKVVESELSPSPSLFPSFIKFIFSFILVIGLLFVLLRILSKRNMFQTRGPVIHLGGQHLGKDRSLQILLIGQTIYIIGVGEEVTLVRTISQGEEYQHLLEIVENQPEIPQPNWLPKDSKKLFNDTFVKYLKKMKQGNGGE